MPETAPCCHITPLNNMLGSHPASDRLPTAPQSRRKNLPPPCATLGQTFLYLKSYNARHQQMLVLQQATRVVHIKDEWASLVIEGPTHLMAAQYCGCLAVPNYPLLHSTWQSRPNSHGHSKTQLWGESCFFNKTSSVRDIYVKQLAIHSKWL